VNGTHVSADVPLKENLNSCIAKGLADVNFQNPKLARTVEDCLNAAKRGDVEAQFEVASAYQLGHLLPRNMLASIFWFQEAANQNHVLSLLSLVVIYSAESDDNLDIKKAFNYLAKAAALNFGPAMLNLGHSYQTGWGVEQNYKLAREWYLKAATEEAGYNEKASFNLGLMYEFGIGVKRDLMLSHHFYFFASAAENPVKEADERLKAIASQATIEFQKSDLIPADFDKQNIETPFLSEENEFDFVCPLCNAYNVLFMDISDDWVDTTCGQKLGLGGCEQGFRYSISGRLYLKKNEPGDQGKEAIEAFERSYFAAHQYMCRDPGCQN
jgi:TPR repeat protein